MKSLQEHLDRNSAAIQSDEAEQARADSTWYRAVAMYQDAEISEGYGHTKNDALADAKSQISPMYPSEDITFTFYPESFDHEPIEFGGHCGGQDF